MTSIIDDTAQVLANLGLTVIKVSTPPGYAGLQVNLPHDNQAFFVWSKIDQNDYHFRLARFWANENPFSMWVCPSLTDAIAKTRVMTIQ